MTTLTIGRDQTCDIVVDDQTVSRRHAELELCDDGGYRLIDLDSRNGTFILVGRRFVRATQAIVGADDKVKLSTVQSTVRDLLALADAKPGAPAGSRPKVNRTEVLAASAASAASPGDAAAEGRHAGEHRWPAHQTFAVVALFNLAAWAGIAMAVMEAF